jgi:hypothetical protein
METREFNLTPAQMAQIAEVDDEARFTLRFGIKFKRPGFYVAVCGGIYGFGTR